MPSTLFKLTVKDQDGKVIQIHEVYRADVCPKIMAELDRGYVVTVRELTKA